MRIKDVMPNYQKYDFDDLEVYVGGPLNNNELVFCYFKYDKVKDSIINKFHISKDEASERIREGSHVRAFLGHSAWTPYQLEIEIKENSWFIYNFKTSLYSKIIKNTSWKNILSEMSPWHFLISKTPDNPSLN